MNANREALKTYRVRVGHWEIERARREVRRTQSLLLAAQWHVICPVCTT